MRVPDRSRARTRGELRYLSYVVTPVEQLQRQSFRESRREVDVRRLRVPDAAFQLLRVHQRRWRPARQIVGTDYID